MSYGLHNFVWSVYCVRKYFDMSFLVAENARKDFNDAETASRESERDIRFDNLVLKCCFKLSS